MPLPLEALRQLLDGCAHQVPYFDAMLSFRDACGSTDAVQVSPVDLSLLLMVSLDRSALNEAVSRVFATGGAGDENTARYARHVTQWAWRMRKMDDDLTVTPRLLGGVDATGATWLHHILKTTCDRTFEDPAVLVQTVTDEVLEACAEVADDNGDMPLHVACYMGQARVLLHLLRQQRTSLNRQLQHANNQGETPVLILCRLEHWELLEHIVLLLGEDCNLLQRRHKVLFWDATTALIDACSRSSADSGVLALAIVEKSPRDKVIDSEALLMACRRGQEDVALRLLASGVTPMVAQTGSDTALIAACKGKHGILAAHLLQRCPEQLQLNHRDSQGRTALLAACQVGMGEVATTLCDWHADHGEFATLNELVVIGGRTLTPLTVCLINPQMPPSVARHIVFAGGRDAAATAAMRTCAYGVTGDLTPFEVALCCQRGSVAQAMLEVNRDACHVEHIVRGTRDTPLLLACAYLLPEVALSLLRTPDKCHASQVNNKNNTVLLIAIRQKQATIVRKLLERPHDCGLVAVGGEDRRTPLHLACQELPEVVPSFLQLPVPFGAAVQAGTDMTTPLMVACQSEHVETCLQLLALPPDDIALGATCSTGHTALHFAWLHGLVPVVQRLLQLWPHCSPTARDDILQRSILTLARVETRACMQHLRNAVLELAEADEATSARGSNLALNKGGSKQR